MKKSKVSQQRFKEEKSPPPNSFPISYWDGPEYENIPDNNLSRSFATENQTETKQNIFPKKRLSLQNMV